MTVTSCRTNAGLVSAAAAAGLIAWMALWAPPSEWTRSRPMIWALAAGLGLGLLVTAYSARWAALGRVRGGWARHTLLWLALAGACWWVGLGAATFWLKRDFWFASIKNHAWETAACLALALAISGWRRRTGGRPHCRRCRYEKAALCGPVCPECGSDWSTPRGVVLGVPRWEGARVARLIAGIVVLLALYPTWRLVDAIPGGGLAARIASLFHTDDLITLVTPEGHRGRKDWHTWNVLLSRPLSADQEARLARRILASRRWRGALSNVAEPWMLSAASQRRLPPDLIDAYFEGIARPTLTVSRWPEGPGAEVAIGGTYLPIFSRFGTANKQQFEARMYVSHFEVIGGNGAAEGGDLAPVRARYRLGDPGSAGGLLTGRLLPGGNAPSVRFVPPESGAATVKAVLWLVYVTDPPVTAPSQEWNDDGTPRLPDEVLWAKRLELEVEVSR